MVGRRLHELSGRVSSHNTSNPSYDNAHCGTKCALQMVQLKGKIKGIALAKAIQRITNARPATKPSQPYPPGVTSSSSPPKPRVTTILTPCTTVATYSFHTTTRSIRIGVGLEVIWETVVWHRPHLPSVPDRSILGHLRRRFGSIELHGAYHSKSCSHRRRHPLREGGPWTSPGRAS